MTSIRTKDKTSIRNLGFCSCGISANASMVDALDGRIVRIRPLHYDQNYTKEQLNYYTIEKDGHVWEPEFKTLIPPLSLAYKNRTYSKNRVPYPLIRVDWDPEGQRNTQNRGKSKYQRISWDDALDIIAKEIKRIHDDYGPSSIYVQGEGHGETKIAAGGHGVPIEMLRHVGGCTIQARQPDSWEGWYWGAKHMWGMEPNGECDLNQNVFYDITKNGDAVFFWGCDAATTPLGWGGYQAERMVQWFNEIGVKSVFVCPDVNYSGAVHADKWIPVLPNTDAAMQLAIAHVWLTEETYDREYLDTHAIGFDWFESYVLGTIDGVAKTPEWASPKCGIKTYTIKALARYWARHAVSICHGNGGGYIRSVFAHEPARLEVALLGMQAVGKPGANQFKTIEWTLYDQKERQPVPISKTLPSVMDAFHGWDVMCTDESFIPKTLLPQAITNPPIDWYGHTTCVYPREDQFLHFEFPRQGEERLHMIWSDAPCWATCWNGGNEYQDALRHESIEFVLVQHPWFENDCTFADIVLPISTMMECDDIATDNNGGQFALFFKEDRLLDPLCESVSDMSCCVRIARKLEEFGGTYTGLADKLTRNRTLEESFEQCFEKSGIPDEDFTYEDLKNQGFWASPIEEGWEDQPAGLARFYEDPEHYPLSTPTGKIEYYATGLVENFPDDKIRAPYPQWIEESDEHQERQSSKRAENYPYLLMSNHPHWRVHAQLDDVPWFREIETCKIKGPDGYAYEPVWINPLDAEREGIEQGDIVGLFNERGTVLGAARLTERIRPGALYQDHGARIDSIVAGTGGLERAGANNLICPSPTTSKNAVGEVTNGFLTGIKKVDVFELAKQYPEQFSRKFDSEIGLIPTSYIVEEG